MRSLRSVFVMVLLGLISAGCGGSLPPTADKETAITSLKNALDAWQKGEKPEALSQRNQSIQMVDSDWSQGLKLSRYEIDETKVKPSGFDQGIPTKLWLVDGKKNPVVVNYTVATSPNLIITRNFAE
jgi:hypothetical protein